MSRLSETQQDKLIHLLWDYLPERDGKFEAYRMTGRGMKTMTGLIAAIETIVFDEVEPAPLAENRKEFPWSHGEDT